MTIKFLSVSIETALEAIEKAQANINDLLYGSMRMVEDDECSLLAARDELEIAEEALKVCIGGNHNARDTIQNDIIRLADKYGRLTPGGVHRALRRKYTSKQTKEALESLCQAGELVIDESTPSAQGGRPTTYCIRPDKNKTTQKA